MVTKQMDLMLTIFIRIATVLAAPMMVLLILLTTMEVAASEDRK